MLEGIKRWLRGDYNSIRYRFGRLPKEWLRYICYYRLRGLSWVDFYADRLDRAARLSADKPLQESYAKGGKEQLEYLVARGLLPEDRLLDYGCGVMRAAPFLCRYLKPGHYVGVDIAAERISKGRKLMASHGFSESDYAAICVSDCTLPELLAQKFEFVWANSVVTHMPQKDIREMLRSIRRLLNPGGKFYFTFAEANEAKRKNIKDFWYPRSLIEKLCADAGFNFEIADNWGVDRTDVMAVATPRIVEESDA